MRAEGCLQQWSSRSETTEFGKIAKAGNTLVLPANLSGVGSMVSLATNVIRGNGVASIMPAEAVSRTAAVARHP